MAEQIVIDLGIKEALQDEIKKHYNTTISYMLTGLIYQKSKKEEKG